MFLEVDGMKECEQAKVGLVVSCIGLNGLSTSKVSLRSPLFIRNRYFTVSLTIIRHRPKMY